MRHLFLAISILAGPVSAAVPEPVRTGHQFLQTLPEGDVAAFRRLRAEAVAAATAGDPDTAARLLAEADRRVPNHPGLILLRARVAAGQGQAEAALDLIERYSSLGLSFNLAADRVLSTLSTHPRWLDVVSRLEANRSPVGAERLSAVAAIPDLVIAEGLVRDQARGRWLVSQVRGRTVVALSDEGQSEPFLAALPGLGAIVGLTQDPAAGHLWAVTAPLAPALHGRDPGEPRPGNALLQVDAASGVVLARYPAPEDRPDRTVGDVARGVDGTLYVADSTTGDIFRLRPGAAGLEPLVPAGVLGSPQGMMVTPDGRALIVSDYASGLWRIDLATSEARRMPAPATTSLLGIDGLIADGQRLYAIQNGVTPHRVLRLMPDSSWSRIDRAETLAASLPEIDEPTTGMIHDGALVFVSRSQWSDVDADGAPLPAATRPAMISRLRID